MHLLAQTLVQGLKRELVRGIPILELNLSCAYVALHSALFTLHSALPQCQATSQPARYDSLRNLSASGALLAFIALASQ